MDTRERGVAAATAYLERAGQGILISGADSPPGLDIVSVERDTLVGTIVRTSREAGAIAGVSGPEFAAAMKALRSYTISPAAGITDLRIDFISLLAIVEDRALLRHHRGVNPQ